MIVFRDWDQDMSSGRIRALLSKLCVGEERILPVSDGQLQKAVQGEQILFITPMTDDWLGYHQAFVEAHKEQTASWIVLVTGDDPVAMQHIRWFFKGRGIPLELFAVNEYEPEELFRKISSVKVLNKNKILLYSLRPSCGKKTLKKLLEQYLDGWTIETAQEDPSDPSVNALEESDASVKVIVSDRFEELVYAGQYSKEYPFFVMTMPDKQAALYLRSISGQKREYGSGWTQNELKALAGSIGSSAEAVKKRLFFVSPLYELWEINETDPRMDPGFVIWDDFGLPVPRDEYCGGSGNMKTVRDFLSQFTQGRKLAEMIRTSGIMK